MKTQVIPFSQIAIFGAGLSGRAAYQRARDLGITCLIDDDVSTDYQAISKTDICPYQEWDWASVDALILSPGIPHNHPEPHPVAKMALSHNVPIISEVEFGLQTGNWGKLIVITGTNGKSTTTALTGHLLERAGKRVQIGGNLGTPLCALSDSGATSGDEEMITVLELSSYQLETTPSLAPHITALLNVTPDHLDRHGGLDGYVEAKKQSLRACRDDGLMLVGNDGPLMGDIISWAQATLDCQLIPISCDDLAGHKIENPYLAGVHNAQNAAFAIAIAKACGCDEAAIATGLADFIGLDHRMQPVGASHNIRFVNDSKATNGDASAKALSAYSSIIWLAGGRAKADGLAACRDYFDTVLRAHFYGESGADFHQEASSYFDCTYDETLDEAFARAITDLPDKAVILLSPAAASFDQFANFGARGAHFTQLAKAYIEQGAVVRQNSAKSSKEASHVR